jgi:FtsH-binding integral membrane protein
MQSKIKWLYVLPLKVQFSFCYGFLLSTNATNQPQHLYWNYVYLGLVGVYLLIIFVNYVCRGFAHLRSDQVGCVCLYLLNLEVPCCEM